VLAQKPMQAAQHYVLPMPMWPVRESALLKRLAVRGAGNSSGCWRVRHEVVAANQAVRTHLLRMLV
jgi:hypothetical protein